MATRRPLVERVLGTRPGLTPLLLLPTAVTVLVDYLVRGRLVVASTTSEWVVYAFGVTFSTLAWGLTVWGLARLHGAGHRRLALAVAGLGVAPVALLTFSAQIAYFHYAGTYASGDALTIAWRFRSAVVEALRDLWPLFLPWSVFALLFAAGVVALSRALAPGLAATQLHAPLMALCAGGMLCFRDLQWTRDTGALPPDASLLASVVGLATQRREVRGLSVRTPLAVPPLTPARRRTVILVVTESVRADVFPSALDPARPSELDEVIADRIPLGLTTSQASSTIVSCLNTWTGLPPTVDLDTAHRAPLLFEIARAAGYRTAYVGAQRGDFHRFGAFLQVAGLDVHVQGEQLDPHVRDETGAHDDLATARALAELTAHPEPTFLLLHLSSTHYPYRVDDALTPHQPMSTLLSRDTIGAVFNRYRNSVLLQERILRDFFRSLRALPGLADAVTLFVSDHGEQFLEHGAFTHIRSLHDEEVRVPGFLVAGPAALTDEQRAALASYRDRRVYNQDVSATVLDLLGVWDARAAIPLADQRTGRSLLRTADAAEPVVLLANRNGVWDADRPTFGAMQGARKVSGRETEPFVCFDTLADPAERRPRPAADCGAAYEAARQAFPFVPLAARP